MSVNQQRFRQLLSMEEGDRVRAHMLNRLKTQQRAEGDGIFVDQHLVTRALNTRPESDRRKGKLLIGFALAVIALVIAYLGVLKHSAKSFRHVVSDGTEKTQETSTASPSDSYFVEPESVIVNPKHIAEHNETYSKPCPIFPENELLQLPADSIAWKRLGKELKHSIKESDEANKGGDAIWSNHFGYGNRVALSGNGNQLALIYAGVSGKDKAFGTHIDMFHWNRTAWEKMDTLTDVTRFHGHVSHAVHFQSLQMSKDGSRVAFADGHGGVHVSENQGEGWVAMPNIEIPSHVNASRHQFGTDLAMNCDGSIIAVSGTSPKNSFTLIFRWESSGWVDIGEIQGKRFGGSIGLSLDGTRLVMGTVASESWKGVIRVFDFDGHDWNRVGQPIVGKTSLEMFAGSVDLSDDGNVVVGTTKDGNSHRVEAFQLLDGEWKAYGQELQGSGNPHEHYGSDVKMSGDGTVLAVGAPGDLTIYKALQDDSTAASAPVNDIQYQRGRIYIYRMVNGSWQRIDHGKLKGATDGDLFGKVIAMSADGGTVTGGAPVRKGKTYQHFRGSAKTYRAGHPVTEV